MLTVSKMGLPVTTSIRPYVLSFDAAAAGSRARASGAPIVTNCADFSSCNFQTGRESPPSLRTRQKCTMVNSVTTAGSTATCSTQKRTHAARVASQHHLANPRAPQRSVTADVRPHRDGPESELVPWQKIAGERESQGEQEQHHADHPVELPRPLVRPR